MQPADVERHEPRDDDPGLVRSLRQDLVRLLGERVDTASVGVLKVERPGDEILETALLGLDVRLEFLNLFSRRGETIFQFVESVCFLR